MPLEIQIHIVANEEGELTDREKNILTALGGGNTVSNAHTVVFEGNVPDAETLERAAEFETAQAIRTEAPEAEKPKRTRRSKAQIAADEAAEAAAKAAEEADNQITYEDPANAPKASEAPAETTDTDPTAEEPSTTPAGADDPGTSDADDDFLGVETPKPAAVPTIEEVVERVSVLMKKGKQEACKALLEEVTGGSAKRVSQMDPKFIPAYVAGLDKIEGK